MTHTPEPWVADHLHDLPHRYPIEILAKFGGTEQKCVVARVYSWEGRGHNGMNADELHELQTTRQKNKAANAQLIVASPTMFAALKGYLALREADLTPEEFAEKEKGAIDDMRAAVELAEIDESCMPDSISFRKFHVEDMDKIRRQDEEVRKVATGILDEQI